MDLGRGTPLAMLPIPGPPGLPSGSSLGGDPWNSRTLSTLGPSWLLMALPGYSWLLFAPLGFS